MISSLSVVEPRRLDVEQDADLGFSPDRRRGRGARDQAPQDPVVRRSAQGLGHRGQTDHLLNWYLARSRALSTGLSNAYFKSLGLPSLFQSC